MIKDTSQSDRILATPMAWYKRRLVIGLFIGTGLISLMAISLSHWSNGSFSISAERLRFADVHRGNLVRDVNVNGNVIAAESATLYMSAAGSISLKRRAGDSVKLGDELAIIDSPELNNELQRERSVLSRLRSELSRQKIEVERLKLAAKKDADETSLALLAAQRDWQRLENACVANAIAKLDCLEKEDAVKRAEIRHMHALNETALADKSIQFNLATHEQEVQRQALLVQNLERRVTELTLRAPFNGMVGNVAIADRAVLPINAAVMTVVDLNRLAVELAVPESYADEVGIDMGVEISLAGESRYGKIAAISPEVTNNQVLVRVRLDSDKQSGLRQNQRVSARILFEEKNDVLIVQRGPFVESGGGRFVYVLHGNTAIRRPIHLGATSTSAVEIISGLTENERIVISGTENFDSAERIQVN